MQAGGTGKYDRAPEKAFRRARAGAASEGFGIPPYVDVYVNVI